MEEGTSSVWRKAGKAVTGIKNNIHDYSGCRQLQRVQLHHNGLRYGKSRELLVFGGHSYDDLVKINDICHKL